MTGARSKLEEWRKKLIGKKLWEDQTDEVVRTSNSVGLAWP
jgi:hypothetical protein